MATSQFLNLDTDGTLSTNSDTVVPSEKAIKTYVDSKTVSADSTTIENNANVLSAVGVIDQNTGNADKFWTGTKAALEAIATKDDDTTYRTTDEAEPESVRRIGEIVPSLLPLFDAGLHLLDGSVLSGVGVYSTFVSYVAGLVTNYPNLFTTEANWQSSVTTYGVCGKFVYNSVANTVRLPKITGIIEGTIDVTVLGDLVEAGLPNITGNFSFSAGTVLNGNGAFSLDTSGVQALAINASAYSTAYRQTFDASRSSSAYGNSTTVQPQTIKAYYYIVVSTFTKTEIESDIDQIASDLNLKAGTDLANLNNAGKIVGAGLGMPSGDTDETVTVPASGGYVTAPANGYFSVFANFPDQASFVQFSVGNLVQSHTRGHYGYQNLGIFVPAKKGQQVYMYYNNVTFTQFYFIYAEGSKSEKV